MKKKSKKFERCVLGVKKKGSSVNPWAVCHAALGKKAYARDPKRSSASKRVSKFPIKHSDGKVDRRYTVAKEYDGSPTQMWVARFQGEWIASAHTREGAVSHAKQIWEHRQRSLTGARDPKKRARKTTDLYVVQGHYGQGWEDLTAAETRKEARGYLKDYRENEPSTPTRLVHKLERIQLRLPGVRDPRKASRDLHSSSSSRPPRPIQFEGHAREVTVAAPFHEPLRVSVRDPKRKKKKSGKKRPSRAAVMALAKKYAQARAKRRRS